MKFDNARIFYQQINGKNQLGMIETKFVFLKYVTLKIRQYRTIIIIAIELNNVNLFTCREYRKSKLEVFFARLILSHVYFANFDNELV